MTTSVVSYLGDLRTECTHTQSKNTIITDAPIDNCGKGEAFSPTDLLATSLATCMLTIMGIISNREGIAFKGAKAKMNKTMSTDQPRRVVQIQITITMPKVAYTNTQKETLEEAARNCPVAKSIHPDIQQVILFTY